MQTMGTAVAGSVEKIPFTAYRVALGCFFGIVMAAGFSGSFSVFLPIVTREFGWGRAVFSGGFFVSTLITACCYPLFGYYLDKLGTRKVLWPALIIHGLSIMAMALMNGSRAQMMTIYVFFGVGSALSGYIAYVRLLAAWFPHHRGMALGIVIGGAAAVGTTLQPQIARHLIEAYGWRQAYVLIGVPFLVLALPNLLLIKDPPSSVYPAAGATAAGGAVEGMSGKLARRTRTFWLMLLAFVLFAVGWEGPRGHMVALLTDRGFTLAYATNVLSIIAVCGAAGRVLEGFLMDRFQNPLIGVPAFMFLLVGLLLLDQGGNSLVGVAALILGLGIGSEQTLIAYFVARYFGMRHYAQIYGSMMAAVTISLGLGPYIMGSVFDALGSYHRAFQAVQVMILISSILVVCLGPYVYDTHSRKMARPVLEP